MERKNRVLCFCIFLTLWTFSSAFARTIYVDKKNTTGIEDGTFEKPYSSIQTGGINAASGDVIAVLPDVYYENIQITVPLTLTSVNGSATIAAANPGIPTVEIRSNGVSINGFILTGSQVAGVKSDGYANCVISNNTIKANSYGIMIYRGSNFRIENNIIRDQDCPVRELHKFIG